MSRLGLSIPAALAAHKHKIAVTAASATAVTGAVVGALAATAPGASASVAPAANAVVSHAPVHAAAHASASPTPSAAEPSPLKAAAVPPEAKTPAKRTVAPKPAVHKRKVKAPVRVKADPYAGLSAYQIAKRIVPSGEFSCFSWVVDHESGWNVHATNPSSGAYGLGQALPGSKMASEGSDWRDNPVTQIKWVLGYMDGRYGSPCGAKSFWESHNWY